MTRGRTRIEEPADTAPADAGVDSLVNGDRQSLQHRILSQDVFAHVLSRQSPPEARHIEFPLPLA